VEAVSDRFLRQVRSAPADPARLAYYRKVFEFDTYEPPRRELAPTVEVPKRFRPKPTNTVTVHLPDGSILYFPALHTGVIHLTEETMGLLGSFDASPTTEAL